MGRMAKWFIDSGMRKGTPKELHENVITVYGGVDRWKKAMGFSKALEHSAYLALVGPDGRVQWLHRGGYSEEAFSALSVELSRAPLEGHGSQLKPLFDWAAMERLLASKLSTGPLIASDKPGVYVPIQEAQPRQPVPKPRGLAAHGPAINPREDAQPPPTASGANAPIWHLTA